MEIWSCDPRSSMALAAPVLASCILVKGFPAWSTVMDMEPDLSMTIAMATANFRCSFFSSMETGRSGSIEDSKYPPEPKDCFPPAMSRPPPCSLTKKFNALRKCPGISKAGTLLMIRARVPDKSPTSSCRGLLMVSTVKPC